MKENRAKYVEPKDYLPKDVRKKYGLGEFAEHEKKNEEKTLDQRLKEQTKKK